MANERRQFRDSRTPPPGPFGGTAQTLQADGIVDELSWLAVHTPLTGRSADRLAAEQWADYTFCLTIHLDLKVVPLVEALLRTRARVMVLGANPATTRDAVAQALRARGAEVLAAAAMDEPARMAAVDAAIEAAPDFISEMGGDVMARLLARRPDRARRVRAGMEATTTGLRKLEGLDLPFPVFNWNDLPLKEGLHNRYLVGLTVWNTFMNVTNLTLYGRRVLVIGFGPVGRGLAEYARRLGAIVTVAEPDARRRVEAGYMGCIVQRLEEALPTAQVIVTATGRDGALGVQHFAALRPGAILLNAGHSNGEIDVAALRRFPTSPVRPHVEEVDLGDDRRVYLLAGGAMLNLAAGPGDAYDTFDLVGAIMLEGIRFMVGRYHDFPPGLHLFPPEVETLASGAVPDVPGTKDWGTSAG